MSREDFLSSNLYSMRDRLKRNAEQIRQQSANPPAQTAVNVAPPAAAEPPVAAANNVDSGAEAAVTVTEQQKPPQRVAMLPSLNVPFEGSAAGRDRRELEGALLRDFAFAERAEKDLAGRHHASVEYVSFLGKNLTALRELDKESSRIGEKEFARRIQVLRGEFYYASGRFEAALRGEQQSSPGSSAVNGSVRCGTCNHWVIFAGTVIAAAIVAAAVFGAWKL